MSELAVSAVTASDAKPSTWIVFLHGILGSGANWRTFARQIVAAKPEWGALLVDLRLHGDSVGLEGPHTLEAAARDVVHAVRTRFDGARIGAILGHSFGGKVALELTAQLGKLPEGAPEHVFVIDSTPGERPDARGSSSVRQMVDMLMELPQSFPNREAFTSWVEARGVNRPTAMWLAMNVRPDRTAEGDASSYSFRIDVLSVREMLKDYFARDLWPVLERPPSSPSGPTRFHVIAGGKSEVMDATDLARARAAPSTTVDVIEGAGHWVHVDAPDCLRELVLEYL